MSVACSTFNSFGIVVNHRGSSWHWRLQRLRHFPIKYGNVITFQIMKEHGGVKARFPAIWNISTLWNLLLSSSTYNYPQKRP